MKKHQIKNTKAIMNSTMQLKNKKIPFKTLARAVVEIIAKKTN